MVYQSPQNIHTELVSVLPNRNAQLLSLLKSRESFTDGGEPFAAPIDESLFPSPPMSPLLFPPCKKDPVPGSFDLSSRNPIIKVVPSWTEDINANCYRKSNLNFLSQYRSFKTSGGNSPTLYSTNISGRGRPSGGKRLRAKEGQLAVNNDHVYRTRGLARKRTNKAASTPQFGRNEDVGDNEENCDSDENSKKNLLIKKPVTPIKRIRKPATSAISPLASINAIGEIQQYIPKVSCNKLPDYSPSLSTLKGKPLNCLSVEWKGSQMDLSTDLLKDQLHPSELVLAQILRLPCDLYIDSKKRLFLEKVYRLKKRLPFRRTDAQKACKIDVNKASRLYTAFEKVGWLNDSNFNKFL
ncbi:hypothetical protein Kpol_1071p11 [Vanderwaltozyma polyspora DSM 70294]|uniref:SWIRM domain-containing protein n=1 Tax=Vanderwaltozyma polyspora (strain ATCC 22028 / DSM 70294 / BCRC 21397 / CBS 2163 / NBRC 10782 / NRRL Y-8283 / UCD 57-17) TaxID=436907 RepID=A7TRK6_VANPO|nr:uncharacterized protein Kpol_1071p11 [Vanderwaltozyma polyspora DSM 70294]EDO15104.1 hypothetical protein Kpol_1071p11 [Vanderwaltozyma polyspora DSM 70294]